jgi:hypothetical protein
MCYSSQWNGVNIQNIYNAIGHRHYLVCFIIGVSKDLAYYKFIFDSATYLHSDWYE